MYAGVPATPVGCRVVNQAPPLNAAKRGRRRWSRSRLREPEVAHSHVASSIDEDVRRLDVSMKDSLRRCKFKSFSCLTEGP